MSSFGIFSPFSVSIIFFKLLLIAPQTACISAIILPVEIDFDFDSISSLFPKLAISLVVCDVSGLLLYTDYKVSYPEKN